MIPWGLFILIFILDVIATAYFVPASHRQNYANCRKDATYYLAALFWHGVWIVSAIQSVISPSLLDSPRLFGVVLMVAGHALVIWAKRVNGLFVPALIYVAPSRRVKRGPYRFITHPGYAGFVWTALGAFCLLGQSWAVFPLVAYVILILYRTHIENRILSQPPSV